MTKIQNCKQNWLLFTFFILLVLGLLGFLFLDTDQLFHNSRTNESVSLGVFLLFGIVFAPVLEELSFRGLFLSNKKLIVVSLILLSCFSLFSYENYYIIAIFVLLINTFFVYKFYPSKLLFKLICIFNALLFGFIHYQVDDFTSIDKGFIILFQISIGFLLIWVTLNFGLIKSMLVHAAYNAIALSFLIISVQFPDTKINTYEDENITVEWQRVPYFGNSRSSISSLSDGTEGKNTSINFLYTTAGMGYSEVENEEIIQTEMYMKYNFKIHLKENIPRKNIKKAIYNFFLNEGLIAPIEVIE